ncbi:MAG: DUF1624 domain-containing protein [Frankia sp.]|nr:DUF1624 domain-containing protein [Frankia sp.]
MVATHVFPPFDELGQHVTRSHLVFSGRSAAAFAVLAGVALTLSTARAASPVVSTLVRAVCVGAIGLVLGALGSGIAIILPYYAVLFVLALPLLRASRRVLAAVAATALLAVPVLSQLVRPRLPEPVLDQPRFATVLTSPLRVLRELLLTGYYPALAWIGYLAVGMLVGRLDLRSARTAGWLLGAGAAVAGLASTASWLLLGPGGGHDALLRSAAVLPGVGPIPDESLDLTLDSGMFGTTPTDTWWWLAVDTPHSSTPFDLVHTTGTALALLGAALLVAGAGRTAGRVLLLPLAAIGSMTLTWYTLHVAVMSTEGLLPETPGASYAVQVALALVVATAWRATGSRGPLEAAIAALARAATTTRTA